MPGLGQLCALHHQLGPAGGGQRQQSALAHDLGVAQGLAGGILRTPPLAELAVDEPEVVPGLSGAAAVAEPLIGQERAAVEAERLVRPAAQMDRRGEIVPRPRRQQAVPELVGQVERLRQRLLGLAQAAALESDDSQQVERPHATVGVAAGAEARQRCRRQRLGDGELAEASGRRGRQQLGIGPPARGGLLDPAVPLECLAEAAGPHQLAEPVGGVVGGGGRDHLSART